MPEPLLRTSYFRVLVGDRELGFSEITPLISKTDREQPKEHRHRFETVVLRRAVTRSSELYEWRKRIADGVDDRRTVTIQQLDRPDGDVANTWRLVGAWPSRWSGPTFTALASDVAMEELELSFEDLVWLKEGG